VFEVVRILTDLMVGQKAPPSVVLRVYLIRRHSRFLFFAAHVQLVTSIFMKEARFIDPEDERSSI
jgi:hypothetical protein